MTSKLLQTSLHEAENQTDLSLRESHTLLKPLLRPPFPLSIPTHSEYLQLNRAIAYAILTEPGLAHTHFTHLAALITDGYEFFVNLLVQLAIESYPKLLVPARVQLVWACSKLVGVSAIGVENLLLSLLRQINGGDFSQPNLWLAMELIRVFSGNWDWVVSEHLLLTSGLYTYLRLLADHYRLSGPELDELKRSEIEFCIRALRECFGVCLRIGRDLLRLLQDLSHIPEFRDVWKDLLSNPAVFRVPGFSDISQIYHSRTSTRYFLLRITPEMETQLRFLLTHVNWGSQKRYQVWFAKKFLCTPEKETIICDIVRFICCAHHPTNEILQSNVISRWAVIGWLLKCCRKNHIEVNAKLALFYDWLFFDEKVDNIMNIEPAVLLMVNSIPKYIDMTHTLLEFLFLLVDNYDINRKNILVQGVLASFDILHRKGVVHSFEKFTSCSTLSAILKQRLCIFIPSLKLNAASEALADRPHYPVPLNLSTPSHVEVVGDSDCSPQALAFQIMEAFKCNGYEMFGPLKCPLKEINHDEEVHSATALVIRTFIFSPHERMNDILLFWYEKGHPVGPRLLSYVSRLANEAHATSGLESSINCHYHINHLSHDGNLLSGYAVTRNNQNASVRENNLGDSLLKCHVDAYFSFMNVRGKGTPDSVISASTVDLKLISQLVTDAFVAYKIYLKSCSIKQPSPDVETLNGICQTNNVSSNGVKGTTQTLVSSLFSDLRSCCLLQAKRSRSLFCSIFCHLSDLSTSKGEFVRLLVDRLDHVDLVATQFDIGLKRFSIFGEDTVMICHLVRTTLTWDSAEQQKFWSLLMSELAVSKVQVEKIVMDLCSDFLDPREDSVAVGGLLQLSRCCSPTPEFVGTIISLPDAFSDFAAAVLASWAASSGLMLSNSLAEWLEKLNSNYEAISVKINYSAITELSKFLDAEGTRSANGLSELSERISNVQSKLANGGV